MRLARRSARTRIHHRKSKYGDMEISDARRLREFEHENAQMKRLLAEAELDKVALKTLVQGTW